MLVLKTTSPSATTSAPAAAPAYQVLSSGARVASMVRYLRRRRAAQRDHPAVPLVAAVAGSDRVGCTLDAPRTSSRNPAVIVRARPSPDSARPSRSAPTPTTADT